MKVKVIKDAFYNKSLVRDGDVIDVNFDKKHIPSWAVPISENKKTVPTVPTVPTEPTEPTVPTEPTENKELLEHLKDIAIEHDIYLTVDSDLPISEQIVVFEKELKSKGIAY